MDNRYIGNDVLILIDLLFIYLIFIYLIYLDLYCFLRENDIMSTMYTESIGISSSLYNINWYKDKIESDSILVNKKFELAENNVWKIENIIISMSTLIEKIEQGYKSIILVDNGILNQNTKGMDCTPYFGHYIFLLKVSLIIIFISF